MSTPGEEVKKTHEINTRENAPNQHPDQHKFLKVDPNGQRSGLGRMKMGVPSGMDGEFGQVGSRGDFRMKSTMGKGRGCKKHKEKNGKSMGRVILLVPGTGIEPVRC